jgi:hypothetical protein
MLSTILGYLRPLAFALAFALAFCSGVSFLDLPKPFGLGLSHIGFCFATIITPILIVTHLCK